VLQCWGRWLKTELVATCSVEDDTLVGRHKILSCANRWNLYKQSRCPSSSGAHSHAPTSAPSAASCACTRVTVWCSTDPAAAASTLRQDEWCKQHARRVCAPPTDDRQTNRPARRRAAAVTNHSLQPQDLQPQDHHQPPTRIHPPPLPMQNTHL